MAAGTRRAKEAANLKASNSDKSKPSQEDNSNSAPTDPQEKATAGQPLGPPPRPSQTNSNDADYFSQSHNANANNGYQAEPNPFEQQFGNPSTNTPGKLPSVAQLTSPQSLLGTNTPSEMRLGPLSPAMLAGPASGDYFDSSYSRSFPTPNESGLRTGLTPGGGGSMFPQPSPNTQAIFNSFGIGGVNTPSINEFIRTGISAKTATANGMGPTSQPSAQSTESMDLKLPEGQNGTPNGVFAHPESDAANGLFMLAQANGARPGNQFAVSSSQADVQQGSSSMAGQASQPQSRRQKQSTGSIESQGDDQSDSDRSEEPAKPATRSRGKKPAADAKTPNNRRKAADTPKGSAAKRRKMSVSQDMDDDDGADEGPNSKDTKKMTDEEKRKNFLERNRVAALKCRQRKKQWLSNLQSKVDIYTQENDALQQCCNQLRDQVTFLKNALAAHRGCPIFQNMGVTQQQYEALLAMEVAVPYMIPGPATSAPNGMAGVPMMSAGQVLSPR